MKKFDTIDIFFIIIISIYLLTLLLFISIIMSNLFNKETAKKPCNLKYNKYYKNFASYINNSK